MEYNYVDNYKELIEDVDECCICLEELDKSQEIVILDCKHKFHLKCYLLWKNSGKPYSNHCPLCLRKDVEISNILNTVEVNIQKPKRLKSYKHIVKTYPTEIEETNYSTTFDIEQDAMDILREEKKKCCIIQ